MKFYAYKLQSISYKNYYFDSSKDIESRLWDHNSCKIRYTKSGMPWILVYFKEIETWGEAMKRDLFFKSNDGYDFPQGTSKVIILKW